MQRYPFTPAQAPKVVRMLVWILLGAGLAITLISEIFSPLIAPYTPVALFSLSVGGLAKLFLWQPLTYLFVVPAPLGFSFVFYLAVELYVIWVAGSLFVDRVGRGGFLRFFFITALAAGLAATGLSALWGGGVALSGAAAAVYALLIAWTMFDPNMQLFVFMVVPVRARTLVLGLLGLNLALNLAGEAYVFALANTFGAIAGYLYGVIAWQLRGPFDVTRRFDDWLGRFASRFRRHKVSSHGRVHRLYPS